LTQVGFGVPVVMNGGCNYVSGTRILTFTVNSSWVTDATAFTH